MHQVQETCRVGLSTSSIRDSPLPESTDQVHPALEQKTDQQLMVENACDRTYFEKDCTKPGNRHIDHQSYLTRMSALLSAHTFLKCTF